MQSNIRCCNLDKPSDHHDNSMLVLARSSDLRKGWLIRWVNQKQTTVTNRTVKEIRSCRVVGYRLSKGAICQKAWIPTFTALFERGYINDSPYHPGLPSA